MRTWCRSAAPGLVTIRRGDTLAFAAPPLVRSGPVDADDVTGICRALQIPEAAIVETTWIDNGPGWVGVLLEDAAAVLALDPDWAAFGDLKIGVVGAYAAGPLAVEVRAFCPGYGMPEDPVTGSLNAGIGQWLAGGRLPASYVASQGTALQRAGRVHVVLEGQTVWVGGDTRTTVAGTVDL